MNYNFDIQKMCNLVLFLNNETGHTANEVSNYMACSARSAQRMLNNLKEVFGESFIKDEVRPKPPRYKIENKQSGSNGAFTKEEILSLLQQK